MMKKLKVKLEHINIKLKLFIMVNGEVVYVMDRELWLGQMVHDMRVSGNLIKPVVKESFTMWMVMFMMEIGLTTKQMVMGFMLTLRVQDMKVDGKKINSMVWVLKHGQKVQCMRVNMHWVKRKVEANILGLIDRTTKVNGLIIKLMVMEFIFGLMEENTLVVG